MSAAKEEEDVSAAAKIDFEEGECPICMCDDKVLSKLECGHLICNDCIDGWKKTGSVNCPTCKRKTLIQKLPQPPKPERPAQTTVFSVEDKIVLILTLRNELRGGPVDEDTISKYESAFGIRYSAAAKAQGVKGHKLAKDLCSKMKLKYGTKDCISWIVQECCGKMLDELNRQLDDADLIHRIIEKDRIEVAEL